MAEMDSIFYFCLTTTDPLSLANLFFVLSPAESTRLAHDLHTDKHDDDTFLPRKMKWQKWIRSSIFA